MEISHITHFRVYDMWNGIGDVTRSAEVTWREDDDVEKWDGNDSEGMAY